jgi:cystathionine beta-lyase
MSFEFDTCPDRTHSDSTKWLRYAGRDIIPAWIADMDFVVAPAITEALAERIKHPVYGYPAQRKETMDAIVEHHATKHGWEINPEWIVFLPALVPGINASVRACGKMGDSVIVPTPAYPPFLSAPGNSARIAKRVPMTFENNLWTFDFAGLEEAATPEASIFLLCNPYNPLGRAFSRVELARIADYCEKHNLIICSDEIHCEIILDKKSKHIPIATLSPEVAQRTISLYSASKTYNIAGLVCGYAIIPNAELRLNFRRAIMGIATDINVFGYIGLETAYKHGTPWLEECLEYLRGNLDVIVEELETIPGITLQQRPQATYLAWLDVRDLELKDPHAAFEEGGVGLGNGPDFGLAGHVRLNFGCPRDRLKEILRRMRYVAENAKK